MLNIIIMLFIILFIHIIYKYNIQNVNTTMLAEVVILVILFFIILYLLHIKTELVSVKSVIDENYYNVMNMQDKNDAANLLALIHQRVNSITDYLYANKDKFKQYEKYIIKLHNRLPNAKIYEGANDGVYTSYSINKGDELIFCLRSIKNKDQLHDINLLMYVALHEISHIACPDIGHDQLFIEIFEFITRQAMALGFYQKIDFNNYPMEYCGLIVNGSVV